MRDWNFSLFAVRRAGKQYLSDYADSVCSKLPKINFDPTGTVFFITNTKCALAEQYW
jgi:hypothetical protein